MNTCTYEVWQIALERYFFSDRQPPFVLFIDDLTLKEIAKQNFQNDAKGEAVESLREVVRSKLVMSENDRIFSNTNSLIAQWKKSDLESAPPVLPILALSVLAATQRNGQGSYYENLARLLASQYDDIATIENNLNSGLSYYSIMDYWKTTDKWIRNKFGEKCSTIRDSNHFTKIGLALSQSFMNASDQDHILSIFKDTKQVSIQNIEYTLSLELTKAHKFSKSFVSAFLKENMRDAVAHACKTIVSSGRKSGKKISELQKPMQLMVDDNPWSIFLKIESDLDVESIIGKDAHGRVYYFNEELAADFYLSDLSNKSFTLQENLGVRTAAGDFQFSAKNYAFMSKEPVLGIYQETSELSLHEKYLVLVSEDEITHFKELLKSDESIRYSGIRDAGFLGLMDHYVVFDLEFHKRESFTEFTHATRARNFNDRQPPGIGLLGGLALKNSLGSRRVFLEGGEPSIQLPKSVDNPYITVVINDVEQEVASNGSILHLRNLGLTKRGLNTVFVDKRNLSFYVQNSLDNTIDSSICPAGVSANEQVVLVGRHSIGTYALLNNGDYRSIATPPVSEIWESIYSRDSPLFFEYIPRADESWIVQRISNGWYLLDLSDAGGAWFQIGDVALLSLWHESTKFPDKKWAWNWATKV